MRAFLRSRDGNIAIISALILPVLVGFCGLATETAYWYYRHRVIQGAADIAAYGAAIVRRGGGDEADAQAAATADAIANGWRQAQGAIDVNSPPASGSFQNEQSVEILLTENQPRYFTRLFFGNTTVPISVRAAATAEAGGPACILGLNPTAASTVRMWGNGSANMNGCYVASNSTHDSGFEVGGSADLTVPCVYSSGGSNADSGLTLTECSDVYTKYPPTPDPYADVPPPPIGSCGNMPNSNPLNPGCYNGMTFNNGTRTLNPGVYVVNGGELRINGNATVNGSGVMFYLTNGATVRINGGATMNLTADTMGTYAGLLMYSDRSQTAGLSRFNGNSSTVLQGALYFPTSDVDFQGNFDGNYACLQIVADQIEYTGSATFNNQCEGTGTKGINTVGGIALVE